MSDHFEAAEPTIVPSIETLLADPSTSRWLRNGLRAALDRDPVDVANDAEILARVLALQASVAVTDVS